ncbi:MAG: PAS domain S-box protein [Desulfamplus sp.]|nr:PAS domain S-box protein [Desulfamplus sp.]
MYKTDNGTLLAFPSTTKKRLPNSKTISLEDEIYNLRKTLPVAEKPTISTEAIQLREQEAQYRELVEALNVGVYRTTAHNKNFLKANTAMAHIFGYDSIEEFMRTSMSDHYQHPEQRLEVMEMLRRNGCCKNLEVPMNKKDGTKIWVSFNVTVKYENDNNATERKIKWIDGVAEDITERKEAINKLQELNEAYQRFVPHEFLQTLGKKSIQDVQLNDRIQKEMSILFSDIRHFCMFSEAMTPEDNFRFINSYLSHMGPIVRQHNGFIDKFIGDSIMALFGGSADDAVSSAIVMLRTLKDYNEGRKRAGYLPVQIGIGINTGTLMLGTLGEAHRMEGTVVGDAVNTASRLEKLTKHYKRPLLISENTLNALKDPSVYDIRHVGRVIVEGRSQPISVYEVSDL